MCLRVLFFAASVALAQCRAVPLDCASTDPVCDPLGVLSYLLVLPEAVAVEAVADTGPLPTSGRVSSFQKISNTVGNFTAVLDDIDFVGFSAAAPGDLDGDGIADVVLGASADDDGGPQRGAVHVLFLNSNGTVKAEQKISDTAGNFLAVLDDTDVFGVSSAHAGDLDGDGTGDLLVGAVFDDDGGADRGAVHVLFLNTNGTVKAEQKISDTVGGFLAPLLDTNEFGASLAGGTDLDADSVPDILVGSYQDDDGGTGRGAVYVLFMNTNGTVKAEQKISDLAGNFTSTLVDGDFFGFAVAFLGDLDGDGVTDAAVGATSDDGGGSNRGAVYILFLNSNGTVKAEQKISSTTGNLTAVLDDDDEFGRAVAGPGDLNGDLIPDLIVGVPGDDDGGTGRGAVYVLFLNADGTVKAEQKISNTAGSFGGILDNDDIFGSSIACPGDLNGDRVPDIVVGANQDDDGGNNRGAAYVLFLEAAQ